MFQSEQLQEKWAPLLNHEGLDKIEDSHKRAVTAVLLENQEKFLREQQAFASSGSFLSEQPNVNTDPSSTGNAGFSGSGASPVAGFDPVLISLIRRSMPNLVAYDLAGVQPMSGPTGLIFAMRSKYSTQVEPRHSSTKQIPHSLDRTQEEVSPMVSLILMLVWVLPKHKQEPTLQF